MSRGHRFNCVIQSWIKVEPLVANDVSVYHHVGSLFRLGQLVVDDQLLVQLYNLGGGKIFYVETWFLFPPPFLFCFSMLSTCRGCSSSVVASLSNKL